jgi:hypothetical protein
MKTLNYVDKYLFQVKISRRSLFISLLLVFTFSILPVNGQWLKHIIDKDGIDDACSVDLAYIDGDSILDVIIANWLGGEVNWYKNDYPYWTKYTIANEQATFAYAGDMDGNDTTDVVVCIFGTKQLLWYENKHPQWIKHTIDHATSNADFFSIADINGDGKPDVIAAGDYMNGGNLVWYENNHPDWIEHIIDPGMKRIPALNVADFDSDGSPDVAATQMLIDKVILYKNEGNGSSWTQYTIDDNALSPFDINNADMNGDNKPDLLVGSRHENWVVWYENNHPLWTKHFIDSNLIGAGEVLAADVDGDDTLDIVAHSHYGHNVCWYEYHNSQWTKHLIDNYQHKPRQHAVTDVDGDHVIDIIISGNTRIAWYKNPFTTVAYTKELTVSPGFIPSQSSSQLQLTGHITNPENHPVTVKAKIIGNTSVYCDSLELFDDGMHGDGESNDSIYGNEIKLSGLEEDFFNAELSVYDQTRDLNQILVLNTAFTTIGPLVFDGYYFTSEDDTLNPGDVLNFKMNIRNEGATVAAMKIQGVLSTSSSYAKFQANKSDFDDIGSGESVESGSTFYIWAYEDCPANTEIPVDVKIFMDESHLWTDTFSFMVYEGPDHINTISKLPVRIYPNPATNLLNIEFESGLDENVSITLQDITGKQVCSAILNSGNPLMHTIDLSCFEKGIYFITISNNQYLQTEEVLIMN